MTRTDRPLAELLPATVSTRLLAYVALQTAAVAILAGVAAGVLRYTPVGVRLYTFDLAASGPAAVAALVTVRAVAATFAAVCVLAPVALVWLATARDDRRWLAPTAWATVAALFVAGAALGAGVLAGPTAGLVEDLSLGPPTVAWDFEYESTGDGTGVLTIAHDGGDKIDADTLHVRGSGFADVAGASRTEPGPWTGETTGGTLEAGDSITVGVTSDCEIRLVYEFAERVQTIGVHECGQSDDGALVERPRDSALVAHPPDGGGR